MIYQLKDVKTGKNAKYNTTVSIEEKDDILTFKFTADNCKFYCPYNNYNDIHSEGDACEVLIGTDPERKTYYEMEISANGQLMLAKMTRIGKKLFSDRPKLQIDFVDKDKCFINGKVERTENGYTAEISFNKNKIITSDGEIYFNAYRLDTDGKKMDKHLFALNPTKRRFFHRPAFFVWLRDYVK